MKTLLVLTTVLTIISALIAFSLLLKIQILYKKLKYVDEANMWHKLAITDDLTGIYNRNAYNMSIDKMKENTSKKSQGIIIFDIDDFKLINDTKGHLAGDEVLKVVAKTLMEVFPEPKYSIFRIGGDEFSVLFQNVLESEVIRRLLILKKRLRSSSHNIRLSNGYSMVRNDVEKAFNYADEMLYADKLSKKYNTQ